LTPRRWLANLPPRFHVFHVPDEKTHAMKTLRAYVIGLLLANCAGVGCMAIGFDFCSCGDHKTCTCSVVKADEIVQKLEAVQTAAPPADPQPVAAKSTSANQ